MRSLEAAGGLHNSFPLRSWKRCQQCSESDQVFAAGRSSYFSFCLTIVFSIFADIVLRGRKFEKLENVPCDQSLRASSCRSWLSKGDCLTWVGIEDCLEELQPQRSNCYVTPSFHVEPIKGKCILLIAGSLEILFNVTRSLLRRSS